VNFSHLNRATIRDLCLEDKKRIAKLIKEVAVLGSENKSLILQLETERRQFEERIAQRSATSTNLPKPLFVDSCTQTIELMQPIAGMSKWLKIKNYVLSLL
jgi:hypothetical protein